MIKLGTFFSGIGAVLSPKEIEYNNRKENKE